MMLNSYRKAVGAATTDTNTKTGPEAAADELRTYDLKVYKAQHQMVKEMSNRLKAHSVPFFGTRSDLVRRQSKGGEMEVAGVKGAPDGRIDEAELVRLQRRMLDLLEDLCKDD